MQRGVALGRFLVELLADRAQPFLAVRFLLGPLTLRLLFLCLFLSSGFLLCCVLSCRFLLCCVLSYRLLLCCVLACCLLCYVLSRSLLPYCVLSRGFQLRLARRFKLRLLRPFLSDGFSALNFQSRRLGPFKFLSSGVHTRSFAPSHLLSAGGFLS